MICDTICWHVTPLSWYNHLDPRILSIEADAAMDVQVQTNIEVSLCLCSSKSEGEKYLPLFWVNALIPWLNLNTTLKHPTMSRPLPVTSEHNQTTAQGARAFQWPKENTRHAVVSHIGSWMISRRLNNMSIFIWDHPEKEHPKILSPKTNAWVSE